MLARLGLLTLFVIVSAYGQFTQNIVYFSAFTGNTTGGTNALVPVIGQTQHSLTYSSTAIPAQTCGTGGGYPGIFQLQGSFDSTNWIPIITASPGTTLTTSGTLFGTGSYPALRITFLTVSAQCAVTISYSGGFAPIDNSNLLFSQTGLNPSATPSVAVAADNTLVAAGGTTLKIVVYGLWLANSGGANALVMKCLTAANGADGTTNPIDTGASTLPTATQITWIASVRPYFGCKAGSHLVLNLSAATGVSVSLLWRYE